MKKSNYVSDALIMLKKARNDIKEYLTNHNGVYRNNCDILPYIKWGNEFLRISEIYIHTNGVIVKLGERVKIGLSSCDLLDICEIADWLNDIANEDKQAQIINTLAELKRNLDNK